MAFNSFYYIFFLLGVFLVYFVTPKRFKWFVLLLASYGFYLLSAKWLVIFLFGSTVTIYLAGLLLRRLNEQFRAGKETLNKEERKALKAKISRRKKAVVVLVLVANFGILFFLKYFNFFGDTLNQLFHLFHLGVQIPPLKLFLPLGISFYTLQAVSYVLDVYRGKYEGDRNFGRVALFVSFFPQIVEGPIGRYDQLAHQLFEGRPFDYKQFTFGWQLIVWGLFKKMVIADRASIFVDTVFKNYQSFSGLPVLLAILLYTLQIYAEFSGCIDIVRGSAQIFGIQLAQNFERPFFSKSINEFWRRWNITLGTWLKDYIFYSVSLSRPFLAFSKKARKHIYNYAGALIPTACALLFVWLGNGIWHGASWKYIVYGLYYYGLMVAGMFCKPLFSKMLVLLHINQESRAYRAFQVLRTAVIVCIGMLIFRADSLSIARDMFLSLFRSFSLGVMTDGSLLKLGIDAADIWVLAFGVILILVISVLQEKGVSLRESIAKKPLPLRWSVYLAAVLIVIIFGAYGSGYLPVNFIYANF